MTVSEVQNKKRFSNYLLLYSIEGRNICRFETTWGWCKLWWDFQFWENYLIGYNGTNPSRTKPHYSFQSLSNWLSAHLNTDPHLRQIHFTVSLCPIVTQPGNAKWTCLTNTGNIPTVFCNGIFRISKGKCRKTEQHAIVLRVQRQCKKTHYGITEAKLLFTAWLTVPVHPLWCFPTPR